MDNYQNQNAVKSSGINEENCPNKDRASITYTYNDCTNMRQDGCCELQTTKK